MGLSASLSNACKGAGLLRSSTVCDVYRPPSLLTRLAHPHRDIFIQVWDAGLPEEHDKVCQIPLKALERAYGGDEKCALTFDELVFRILKDNDLAQHLTGLPTVEWNPRDENDAVSALFLKRNSRGDVGPEVDGGLFKLPKSKSKEKGSRALKKKS